MIYFLRAASIKSLSLLPESLDYFETHFCGAPMAAGWKTPPYQIDGGSYPVRDFVGWMLQAPLVSEAAAEILAPLFGRAVEFLPFDTIKKRKLFAINVLQLDDCLDEKRSKLVRNEQGLVQQVKVAHFDPTRLSGSPIFKVAGGRDGKVFVDQRVLDAVQSSGRLRGAHFVDPTDEYWYLKPPSASGIVT